MAGRWFVGADELPHAPLTVLQCEPTDAHPELLGVLRTQMFRLAADFVSRGDKAVLILSLTAPDRKRPSAADVADLAAGGLRQHLRIAQGLGPGFRLAGLLALTTLAAFATWWAIFEAVASTVPWYRRDGPFLSLGIPAWATWLLAVVVYVAAPGR